MRDDYDVDGAVADDPGPRHGAGPREDDVFWETAPAAERPGRAPGCVAVLAGIALLAGLYVGLALLGGDRVPRDTRISGVAVGGMTHDEAKQALRDGLADRVDAPVTVDVDGKRVRIDPDEAGLAIDTEASLSGLTGFSLAPADLWHHYRGGVRRDIETRIDEQTLTDAVEKRTASAERRSVDGAVRFSGGKVVTTQPVEGLSVDTTATRDRIAEGWPAVNSFTATTEVTRPRIGKEAVDAFVRDVAERVVSGPVTIRAGARSFQVQPAEVTPALSVEEEGGALGARVDDKKLAAAVVAAGERAGVVQPAQDATVAFTGRTPTVTPSKVGHGIDRASVSKPVWRAMTDTGARTARVRVTRLEPELTTAQAKADLPKEKISTFTTYMPPNPPRTENIVIAARTLDGTYVPRGKTLSLNAVLGERTAAKGYNKAPVINAGRLTNSYGGGISQLSTTLFNAVFFSGAKIEEFHPHSFYISRYPEGREATISWPDVDNRFTNDTKGGILVRSFVSGNAVTVELWGTKTWDVKATKSPRRNIRQPKRIVDRSPGCVPQSPSEGFEVTIGRIFSRDGKQVRTSSFVTRYIPEDHVVCAGPTGGGGSSD